MTDVNSTAGLTRLQKQERLRKVLAERISRARTEPASYAQERLWVLDRLQPGSSAYNLPLIPRPSRPASSSRLI